MYFIALAADYDGTLAHNGVVDDSTVEALQRLKLSGRKLLLVTGRELPELKSIFPHLAMFDRVVAENGALLYDPAKEEERTLAPSPPEAFVRALRSRNVTPLSIGRVIVATWEPNEQVVLEVIRKLGLELQIIFNKGSVMVLPAGINKATGLAAALDELEISHHNVVGIGDAENDHAFLQASGCAVAVANALSMVKEEADIVTTASHGAGVTELIGRLLSVEAELLPAHKHGVSLGLDRNKHEVFLEPHRGATLIAGSSGFGKSTIATALSERMREKGFQFCVFDPEGDYQRLEGAVSLGDGKNAPVTSEIVELLRNLTANVVVNLLAVPLEDRPAMFAELMTDIAAFRQRTGRPHWLIVDEAHHLLPREREGGAQTFPSEIAACVFIAVDPQALLPQVLEGVDTIIALGEGASQVIAAFCAAINVEPPGMPTIGRPQEEVLYWSRSSGEPPRLLKVHGPRQARLRHTRKYAEGDLGPDRSFYFRGPDNKLNLKAHNLVLFVQMAAGVDDGTWLHHLRLGDYSRWFRAIIKDDGLAGDAEAVERDNAIDAGESRRLITEAVRRRYTAPAKASEAAS